MTERKWTKGPWIFKRGQVKKDGSQKVKFYGGAWDGFCSVWVRTDGFNEEPYIDDIEGIANAYLIAAAPDLYDALEMVLLESLDTDIRRSVEQALAKARGEA